MSDLTGGTDGRQTRAIRIRRMHATTQWDRDPDSDAYRADLLSGLRGHIFNVRPGKWEWWVSKTSTGAVLTGGATDDVHSAQRAAVAAAVDGVTSGAAASLQW